MARAKHTDRADARRRHRASQAELVSTADDIDDPERAANTATATATGKRKILDSTPTSGARPDPAARPSMGSAFRSSVRPLNLREDIANLPQLIRHRAVWVPVLATTVAGILLVAVGSANQLVNIVAQVFVVPPPMAASFLAGLLAPRSSYLAGGIAGLWSAIVFSGVVFAIPNDQALQITVDDRVGVAAYAFVVAPLFGIGVGGFAGFYRRFLANSSPARRRNEQQTRNTRGGGRAAARRR